VAFAEIEPFPNSVLAHHYPDVPNLGDVTQIDETTIALLGRIDLVVFGSPCQDLSVAGKRKGLAGARSGLFHTAIDIIEWAREYCGCRWALWENVPGAFSSNGGRDFAAVVEHLAGLSVDVPPKGWGTEGCAAGEKGMVEWSTLDAQWFGVAQRRRRVFALADFGDWRGRQPILLEPESLRRDSAPRREAGQGAAADAQGGTVGSLCARDSKTVGSQFVDEGKVFAVRGGVRPGVKEWPAEVGSTLNAHYGDKWGLEDQHALNGAELFVPATYGIPGNWIGRKPENGGNAVAFSAGNSKDSRGIGYTVEGTPPLRAGASGTNQVPTMVQGLQVRRLTPTECERLQGFPDRYTYVPHKGKPAADGPRYKALGNSMARPVMRWIGEQLDMVSLIQ
jgi:DNA (cytosine-5)-methyltransferase 1